MQKVENFCNEVARIDAKSKNRYVTQSKVSKANKLEGYNNIELKFTTKKKTKTRFVSKKQVTMY